MAKTNANSALNMAHLLLIKQAIDAVKTASDGQNEALDGRIAALEALLDDGDNVTAAIDKFNEIVAFLAGIENTETLEGILQGINTAIGAKYTKPAAGIPASDLAEAIQTTLTNAATAYGWGDHSEAGYIVGEFATDAEVRTALGLTEPAAGE